MRLANVVPNASRVMCGRVSRADRRIACAHCARRFLSERHRERHYERNPSHAPAGFDGEGNPPADGWAELERDGETVIVVPRDDEPDELEVTYDPAARTVRVRSGRDGGDERFDVGHVRGADGCEFDWTFDGRYLELAFRR